MRRSPTGGSWLTLALLVAAALYGIPHPSSVAPFVNEIAADLGVSEGLAGQLGATTFLGAMISAISLAPFVARMPLRVVLVAALLTVGVSSVLTGVIPWFWPLMGLRAIAGLASGVILGGSMAALGRAWPDAGERTRRQGFVVGAVAGGPALIAPLLRLLAAETDWQFALIAYGAASIATAVFLQVGLPRLPGDPAGQVSLRERIAEAAQVPRMPVMGHAYVIRFLGNVVISSLGGFLAVFVVREYPGADAWIGVFFAAMAGGVMTAGITNGIVTPRLGGPVPTTRLAVIAGLVLMAAFLWVTPSPVVSAVLLLFWGYVNGVYVNSVLGIVYEFSGERQGAAVFMERAVGPAGGTVGTVVAGFALSAFAGLDGWRVMVTATAAAMLLPMALAVRDARRVRTQWDERQPRAAD